MIKVAENKRVFSCEAIQKFCGLANAFDIAIQWATQFGNYQKTMLRIAIIALIGGFIGSAAGGGGFYWGCIAGAIIGAVTGKGKSKAKSTPKDETPVPPVSQPQTPAPDYSDWLQASPKPRAVGRGRQKSPLRWVEPGETVTIGGFQLSTGLFYICDGTPATDEASAINSQLHVGHPVQGAEAALGYWSQYELISPNQRATYLAWQATNRMDDDPSRRDFGYVFLFFYGIERRLLADQQYSPAILEALARLLMEYAPHGRSKSLPSYVCQLLHFWSYKQGEENYAKLLPWITGLPNSRMGEDELALALANVCKLQQPLPVELAYEIAPRFSSMGQNTVVKRVNEEFRALFQKRYLDKFPGGMMLKSARNCRVVEYRPASPSLLQIAYDRRLVNNFRLSVPDVLGIASQFRPLAAIWDSCVEDLSQYSRAKLKASGDGRSLKAHMSLPEELRTPNSHPYAEKWNSILERNGFDEGIALIGVQEVAEMLNLPVREKWTSGQCREIAQAIQSLGFCVEPDVRYGADAYVRSQTIGVFKPAGTQVHDPSSACLGASALLQLCVLIAAADGVVQSNELDIFRQFIEKTLSLSAADHQRLMVLERLLTLDFSIAKSSLRKITKHVPPEKREMIGQVLVYVALADNLLTKDEHRQLRRIFKAMELSPDFLEQTIQAILPAVGAVTQEGAPDSGEEKTPVRKEAFAIDMKRVAQISEETVQVIGLLAEVMVEDDDEAEIVEAGVAVESGTNRSAKSPDPERYPAWMEGLDNKLKPVLLQLVSRATVYRKEFDAMAAQFNVMPLSAYDGINEWADDELGDFLLEGDEPILVNNSLIPKEETVNG